MKIDFDNLQDLSEAQLMAAWHERMAKAFHMLHTQETGTEEQRQANVKPVLQLNAETGLLRFEIKRRECLECDISPNEVEAIIKLNLN